MAIEGAFPSARLALLTGLAGSGLAVFPEAIGFFFFGAAELGLAGAGFSSIG